MEETHSPSHCVKVAVEDSTERETVFRAFMTGFNPV
jgi:hypothetical protein